MYTCKTHNKHTYFYTYKQTKYKHKTDNKQIKHIQITCKILRGDTQRYTKETHPPITVHAQILLMATHPQNWYNQNTINTQ